MLRVLHVPFTFAPDPVGGTEIYVEALALELRRFAIDSIIAAPSCNGRDEVYQHKGLRVHRYRSAPKSKKMLRELYGWGDPEAGMAFARILDEESPNIVHIHAFTRAVSILLVREAKRRGIPVVFTYHTPTVSCLRGTLMLWGREACDGKLLAGRCTNCLLQSRGVSRWASACLSRVPSQIAKMLEKMNLSGGVWTAFRMAELIRTRHAAFQALMQEVDGIIALREWVRSLLLSNGVPNSKILLSPHGIANVSNIREPMIDAKKMPLRVAFLGRADKVKGIDTVIKAIRTMPELGVELHLYGITQSTADSEYQTLLETLVGRDTRIHFFPPVPHEKVVPLLGSYHLLAVPSRWLETGPLVILEAFLAGTPVIGSNLGGIAEWVQHGQNGLLIDYNDVVGWANALKQCGEDRDFLTRLREGVRTPRSIADVGQEMANSYRRYINSNTHRLGKTGQYPYDDPRRIPCHDRL